ncbi:outer membrane beta-barrel protein [uncultured Alistipes sp.]|uniref:outer membrane beta-barrel protein n=1 Tax=uncultured Alistipes sp. TaxID=538949 RepID=UPI00262BBD31|nr:outer membrane beta-barrel protein [uncultured Alistipes sp.]
MLLLVFATVPVALGQQQEQDQKQEQSIQQDSPKRNIVSLRAGLDLSRLSASSSELGDKTDYRSSFHVGVIDEILLNKRHPLYLQTGLMLHNKGGKESKNAALELMYLQVPLAVNYHIRLAPKIAVIPSVGLYAAFGVHGKIRLGNKTYSSLFGPDKVLSYGDFGFQTGLALLFDKFLVGASYQQGLLNMYNHNMAQEADHKIYNQTWSVSIGFLF